MDKIARRKRRKKSIRKKIFGTAERPRICVSRSNKNIYVQVIDDISSKTLCGVSTTSAEIKNKLKGHTRKNVKFAEAVGEKVAKVALEKGIKKAVFDRSGYRYHGVVKAVAEAARKQGLQF